MSDCSQNTAHTLRNELDGCYISWTPVCIQHSVLNNNHNFHSFPDIRPEKQDFPPVLNKREEDFVFSLGKLFHTTFNELMKKYSITLPQNQLQCSRWVFLIAE